MPARSEIDDKFKWAVRDLYSSDEAWEKDYNSILELTDQPSELKGRMGESAGMLYKALKEYEQVEYITERVYVYAFMKYYEDTGSRMKVVFNVFKDEDLAIYRTLLYHQ